MVELDTSARSELRVPHEPVIALVLGLAVVFGLASDGASDPRMASGLFNLSVLCYVLGFTLFLGWVGGLVFILLEKENKFVRFHAMQSIIVFGAITIAGLIFIWIPFINLILWLLGVVLWIVLMVKAYQGTKFKLPWSGNLAEKWVG